MIKKSDHVWGQVYRYRRWRLSGWRLSGGIIVVVAAALAVLGINAAWANSLQRLSLSPSLGIPIVEDDHGATDSSTIELTPAIPEVILQGKAMGTRWLVRLVLPSDKSIDTVSLQGRIVNTLDALEDKMSTWRPQSAISRFNRQSSTQPQALPKDMLVLLEKARSVGMATGGDYDITVGPLVDLWGFGSQKKAVRLPSQQEIETIRSFVGWQHLWINSAKGTVRKANPKVQIDLSSIAKGYGVDTLASVIEEFGIQRYLVEIGGEVRAHGLGYRGRPWRVGIERPSSLRAGVQIVLEIAHSAVATSGNYRNFVTIRGRQYPHIIRPTTGYPVDSRVISATVAVSAADSRSWGFSSAVPSIPAATADAWATAIAVTGWQRAFRLLDAQGIAVYMLVRDQNQNSGVDNVRAVFNVALTRMAVLCPGKPLLKH